MSSTPPPPPPGGRPVNRGSTSPVPDPASMPTPPAATPEPPAPAGAPAAMPAPPSAGAPPPPPSAAGTPSADPSAPSDADDAPEGDAAMPAHPPVSDPTTGGDPEQLHRTEDTRTYPCKSCGGELHFHIPTQGLKCEHCGVEQAVTSSAAAPKEQDLAHAVAALRSGALERGKSEIENEHEVVCQNCGGRTTFVGSLTATKCPYCATPIQRSDVHEAPARLPVDGVLPFKIDDKTAKKNLDEWVSGRWFAPNAFKKYSESGSFASVYSAYFTYDADTQSWYRGQRGDNYTVTVGSGDNRRTETRTRWRRVSGQVQNAFDDVTVLANTGLERKFTRELEPWPTQGAVGYSPQYVAGHLCRTYDNDVEACFPEAKQRIDSGIEQSIRRDIGGDKQRIDKVDTNYGDPSYKHLLLPIWLLTVIFAGTTYQVFMNGVTGEVQGERPWSKVKIALTVLAVLIVVIGFFAVRGQS